MSRHRETIAALATPVGTAAIALIRVSGDGSAKLAEEIFGKTPLPRLARHGDYRDQSGALVDDVVFTFYAAPASYTGENALEISSHGNPFIAQKILEDLFSRGCRAAMPGEFTQRAFLNGRMDLTQAESVMDLIQARSERALAAANQQLRGSLGRRMNALTSGLLDILARVEAYIDFPDEDLPIEDRAFVEKQVKETLKELERLLASSHYGEVLRDGLKTVIIGEPNAGKSSLLNRIVGYERALVSPEAGTTRDFIEERVMMGPHCLRLTDTAGLNPTPGEIERLGIEKTLERVTDADLLLVVLDVTRPVPVFSGHLDERIRKGPTLVLWNKSDLLPCFVTPADFAEALPAIQVSAVTGAGFEELAAAIIRAADALSSDVGEEQIAISARHADALRRARRGLADALGKLETVLSSELLAGDLREALEAIGEINGKFDNEHMLDRLFSTFCIGK